MVAFIISSHEQVQERNMCILDYTPMHKYVYPGCPRVNNVRLRKTKCWPYVLKTLFLWCTSRALSPRTVAKHCSNFASVTYFVHTAQVRPVLTLQFSKELSVCYIVPGGKSLLGKFKKQPDRELRELV